MAAETGRPRSRNPSIAAPIDEWLVRAFQGGTSPDEAASFFSPEVVERFGARQILDGLTNAAGGRRILRTRRGPLPSIVTVEFGGSGETEAGSVECVLDQDDLLLGVQPAPTGVEVQVASAATLTETQRASIQALFQLTYEHADVDYLDRSLTKLQWVAMAEANGTLVGFSLGDIRLLDLPVVGTTPALLAGLACIDPSHRRHGLFRYLSNLSLRAGGVISSARVLGAGRMAHPASMRVMLASPTLVPRAGVRPSPLQQAVGQVVADTYGVAAFDPETFVCQGSGTPIGYPRMTQEVEPHEWDVFAPVDRSRGDSLLAITLNGEVPDEW